MRTFFVLIVLFLIFLPTPSWALFEVDLDLGAASVNPKDFNDYTSTFGINESKSSAVLSVGFLLFSQKLPIGLGVRQTAGGAKESSKSLISTSTAEYYYDRSAALASFRIYEGKEFYFGLIGGYGFSHLLKIEVRDGTSASPKKWDKATIASYNAGLYTGYKQSDVLGGFIKLGGELGYQFFEATDIKNESGDAPFKKLDLSGVYVQLVLAYGI